MSHRQNRLIVLTTPTSCDWCEKAAVLAVDHNGDQSARACVDHAWGLPCYLFSGRAADRRWGCDIRRRLPGVLARLMGRLEGAYLRCAEHLTTCYARRVASTRHIANGRQTR